MYLLFQAQFHFLYCMPFILSNYNPRILEWLHFDIALSCLSWYIYITGFSLMIPVTLIFATFIFFSSFTIYLSFHIFFSLYYNYLVICTLICCHTIIVPLYNNTTHCVIKVFLLNKCTGITHIVIFQFVSQCFFLIMLICFKCNLI